MTTANVENIQTRLELLTRRWWFFLLVGLVQFIPPYASKGYEPARTGTIVGEILSNCLVVDCAPLYSLFKIAPVVLIALIVLLGNRVGRLFSVYVAVTYVLFAFLQSIAITEELGLGIILGNLIMFLLVAASWLWEAIAQKNVFRPQERRPWRYWVVPVAFLASWYPANPNTHMPDFNPAFLFTNEAGLAFCMMTPVYLAVLTLYHPRVNMATLRVTSLIGIIIGIYNVLVNFVMVPSELWWNGVLHIPLLSISTYAFVLSSQRRSGEDAGEAGGDGGSWESTV